MWYYVTPSVGFAHGGRQPDFIGTATTNFLEPRGSRPQIWRLVMSSIATVNGLKSKNILTIVISAVLPVVVGSLALAAQDRYTLKIPDGLAFSEFRGYETWQSVAVSQTA
jgi:hypothetical protein